MYLAIFVAIILIFLSFYLFRIKFPTLNIQNYTSDDLPDLRKKYMNIFSGGILLLLLNLFVSLIVGLFIVTYFKIHGMFALAIFFLSMSLVSTLYFKGLQKYKSEEWYIGFTSFLNLSYRFNYFKVLSILLKIVNILAILITIFALILTLGIV